MLPTPPIPSNSPAPPSPPSSTGAAAVATPALLSGHAAALLLLLVMVLGLWQLIRAGGQLSGIPAKTDDILQGHTAKALENQFNQHLPWRAHLIAGANGTRYLLMRAGNAQVRVGRDDWLFLSDEIQPWPQAAANTAARIKIIAEVQKKLARDGVKLMVLLVPDKIRLYPQYAQHAQDWHYDEARYPQALKLLASQNIAVVNPLPALQAAQQAAYYRTDTHWNQVGAQIVAQQVAAQVKQLGLNFPLTEFGPGQPMPEQERVGDLLRLMGLEHSPNWLRPAPDRESPVKIAQTSADAASSLLDDEGVPVVLTGTSYSLRGQFHGYLQQALRAKVLNAAKDGAGFWQATHAYLADPAYQSAKPALLIWEIPERFLPAPLDAGEKAAP
jgi:alginate O-acetyltransferase complex protein AlgJ